MNVHIRSGRWSSSVYDGSRLSCDDGEDAAVRAVCRLYSPLWTAVAGDLGQFAHGFGVGFLDRSPAKHTERR